MSPERKERFSKLAKALKGMDEEAKLNFVSERLIHNVDEKQMSVNNTILMLMQRPDNIPTVVGGFKQWLKAGRCVQKGEHGMMIWYPSSRKKEADDTEEETRFFVGTVFDIAQTAELPA